jgi:hypothetical protein
MAEIERRRRAAPDRWQLDEQLVLIAAGERPGGVLAFDPHEGWVDFVVPVMREERLLQIELEVLTADVPLLV